MFFTVTVVSGEMWSKLMQLYLEPDLKIYITKDLRYKLPCVLRNTHRIPIQGCIRLIPSASLMMKRGEKILEKKLNFINFFKMKTLGNL